MNYPLLEHDKEVSIEQEKRVEKMVQTDLVGTNKIKMLDKSV